MPFVGRVILIFLTKNLIYLFENLLEERVKMNEEKYKQYKIENYL